MPLGRLGYEYDATITDVIDGDTLQLLVDCGFRLSYQMRARLLGVDCPEARGPEKEGGKQATEFVRKWVVQFGPRVRIRSHKDPDSFGRWLIEVIGQSNEGQLDSLGATLIRMGFAKEYMR